jgi:hypothetical protein
VSRGGETSTASLPALHKTTLRAPDNSSAVLCTALAEQRTPSRSPFGPTPRVGSSLTPPWGPAQTTSPVTSRWFCEASWILHRSGRRLISRPGVRRLAGIHSGRRRGLVDTRLDVCAALGASCGSRTVRRWSRGRHLVVSVAGGRSVGWNSLGLGEETGNAASRDRKPAWEGI